MVKMPPYLRLLVSNPRIHSQEVQEMVNEYAEVLSLEIAKSFLQGSSELVRIVLTEGSNAKRYYC